MVINLHNPDIEDAITIQSTIMGISIDAQVEIILEQYFKDLDDLEAIFQAEHNYEKGVIHA